MSEPRLLIVNADDYGRSPGINRGVERAHEQGILTSASLMVRWPAAVAAAAYAREHPRLSVGLHVDLAEWEYRNDRWQLVYEVVPSEPAAVERELRAQLERCQELLGRAPTHLDSHQHVHREEPLRSALAAIAVELGVPLRSITPSVHYSGEFYGQTAKGEPLPGAVSAERLLELIRALPPGVTELACHPGEPEQLDSSYRDERPLELAALCDPRVRATLEAEGIQLVSFAELGRE